jgi:mannose-6-phosphate isomerase-like protein (cupin superfamily)
MADPFRRIVTGHDSAGRAIIQSDSPPPRVKKIGAMGPTFHEVWSTTDTPAPIDRSSGEPPEDELTLAPPPRGTRIRVLDFPPETEDMQKVTSDEARKHFAEIGAAEASRHGSGAASHPFMHRTETVDYGIVLEGEITLIVDQGETLVKAGDIVVQRGTNHGWANRSGKNCRVAFILIDGKFTDGLR